MSRALTALAHLAAVAAFVPPHAPPRIRGVSVAWRPSAPPPPVALSARRRALRRSSEAGYSGRRAAPPVCLAPGVDAYAVLGVERSATAAQIKQAYRRLALRSHPDVNKAADAQEQFAKIADAYSMLSDPAQRAKYDRTSGGSAWGARPGASSSTRRPSSSSSSYSSSAASAAAAERARRWREANPTPDELGDSFADFFGDLASAVGNAVQGGDWLSMLEELQFAADGPELLALLRSRDLRLLGEELDSARFVQSTLATRIARLTSEAQASADEAASFQRDAARGSAVAKSMERELQRDVRKRRERVADARRLKEQAAERERRIAARIDEVKNGPPPPRPSSSSASSSSAGRAALPSVEEELKRLKREMGKG